MTKPLYAGNDRISEDNYALAFQQQILPFWNAGNTSMLEGQDRLRLYTWYRVHPEARGQILVSHGYSENSLKYRELAFNFYQRGYSVFILDHRGHGFSDRVGPERHHVDVIRFSDYSDDFRRFYEAMPLDRTKSIFLFGHSMGGAIALDFLQKNPDAVQAAALSAPLFAPQVRGIPMFMILGLVRALSFFDRPDRFSLGANRANAEWTFNNAGTRSLARFEYFKQDILKHDLRLAGPTNRWVTTVVQEVASLLDDERVAKLKVPLFVAMAGKDKLVQPEPIRLFCQKAQQCRLQEFPDSFHELWNERDSIRNDFLDQVIAFYQNSEKK
jgi:lysophospholipase